MRFFGLDITRAKSVSAVDDRRGWWSTVREAFPGAWQRNVEVRTESVLAFHAVFACITLIASDVAKLRLKLVQQSQDGIWSETTNGAYSPVLRKPNKAQTRIQFWESWLLSKLSRGNTYVLKQRDGRGVVVGLHVLDPSRVRPLVSGEGDVFYELNTDQLAGLPNAVIVPAREIIHDRFNCLFHPLVGLSPIFAAGLAATQGLNIQNNSATLFANLSRPGGVITAPGQVSKEAIEELRDNWQANYSGKNAGKLAILLDGLKYEALGMTPDETLMVEQLKWTAEVVCSTFHVPPYKLGMGALPTNSNVESLNLEYYSQCLQSLIEAAELCVDEGLGIGESSGIGVEFDTDNLLRMDSTAQMNVLEKTKNVLTLDERRKLISAPKIKGGDTVYMQEQDHSIAAIAARDEQLIDAVANPRAPVASPAPPEAVNDNGEADRQARAAMHAIWKGLR